MVLGKISAQFTLFACHFSYLSSEWCYTQQLCVFVVATALGVLEWAGSKSLHFKGNKGRYTKIALIPLKCSWLSEFWLSLWLPTCYKRGVFLLIHA